MEIRENLLSQEFASSFGCWFNSDLIDISNYSENISLAGIVVADLMKKGISSQEVVNLLNYALRHWNPKIVDEFSNASDGDWSFSADTENLLKHILQEMIAIALKT